MACIYKLLKKENLDKIHSDTPYSYIAKTFKD